MPRKEARRTGDFILGSSSHGELRSAACGMPSGGACCTTGKCTAALSRRVKQLGAVSSSLRAAPEA
eukprot:6685858-Alexandrium_andersonii.AAC.1